MHGHVTLPRISSAGYRVPRKLDFHNEKNSIFKKSCTEQVCNMCSTHIRTSGFLIATNSDNLRHQAQIYSEFSYLDSKEFNCEIKFKN